MRVSGSAMMFGVTGSLTVVTLTVSEAGFVPPLPSRLSGQPLSVRVAEDGFWIMGAGVSAGTQIACRYIVDGNTMTKAVSFEPGPNGQFIFTGSRPSNVSVSMSAGGTFGSTTSRRIGNAMGMASGIDDDPPFLGHPPAY